MIKNGYLDNCYINDKRINPRGELKAIKEKVAKEHEEHEKSNILCLEKKIADYKNRGETPEE